MIIILVQIVMTLATICFGAGLAVRRSNNDLHRKLMGLGFLLTLSIAVVLVAGVHLFGQSYGAAPWLVAATGSEAGARTVQLVHRIFATATLLLLLVQVYAGVRRLPMHRTLPKALVPAWLISYLSGMVIFS